MSSEEPALDAAVAHEWVFVSDVHLGSASSDRQSRALPRFLEHFRLEGRSSPRSAQRELVLLGDVLEFLPDGPGAPERVATRSGALARFEVLLEGQGEVFSALARLVADGVSIRVVPGNHDLDLHRPEVRKRFAGAIGWPHPSSRGELTFHPWIFVVPGVLHSEHGHRHHDINAVPLSPVDGSGAMSLPAASRAGLAPGPFRPALLAALLRERRPWVRRRSRASPEEVERTAASLGFDQGTVLQLDRMASPPLAATVWRLGRMAVPGRNHHQGDDYLERRAAAIAEEVGRSSTGACVYVFGHNHRARCSGLPSNAVYLNCGTWSEDLPQSTDHDRGKRYFTYASVRCSASSIEASVQEWLDEFGATRVIDMIDVPVPPGARAGTDSPNGSTTW